MLAAALAEVVTIARRETGDKQQVPLARVVAACRELLDDVQRRCSSAPSRTGGDHGGVGRGLLGGGAKATV